MGTALVKRLVTKDYRLAVTYLLPAEAQEFESEFDVEAGNIYLTRVDATNPEAVKSLFQEVAAKWGEIHGLVSLVGGWAGSRDVDETDDVRLERMLDLNLKSAFYAVREAIPYLKESGWGRIILVGSRASIDHPPSQAAYNISKAGVAALGQTVAQELEETEITTNVLMPAVIDTPATRDTFPHADYVSWPTPDEIAAVAEFLLSDDARVMNGALVPVYGRA